jgi:hypothetical protein
VNAMPEATPDRVVMNRYPFRHGGQSRRAEAASHARATPMTRDQ